MTSGSSRRDKNAVPGRAEVNRPGRNRTGKRRSPEVILETYPYVSDDVIRTEDRAKRRTRMRILNGRR